MTLSPRSCSSFLFLAHPSFRRILVLCITPANKTPRVWPRGGQATVTHFPLRFVTFRVLVRQPWLLRTRSFRLCEPLLFFSLIARLCNALTIACPRYRLFPDIVRSPACPRHRRRSVNAPYVARSPQFENVASDLSFPLPLYFRTLT